MYFLVNASPPKSHMQQLKLLQVHWSHDVESTGQCLCDLDAKVKFKGQIMYFPVKASPKM